MLQFPKLFVKAAGNRRLHQGAALEPLGFALDIAGLAMMFTTDEHPVPNPSLVAQLLKLAGAISIF
jgi:hypothetical protein